ncbi:MAG: FeoB-associated Cys-rich membrane protein [Cytophagales bacterium]|nr:FeoB-associated Cys-rich membrane protein [Cytophagales bacterium]
MIQEILTYLILASAVGYVIFKIIKMFLNKADSSGCQTDGCSDCNFKTGCVDERKI